MGFYKKYVRYLAKYFCYFFIFTLFKIALTPTVGGNPVTLGNPAVHKIGILNDDMTFSSFSKSGLPLQINKLHSSMYVYNCSLS